MVNAFLLHRLRWKALVDKKKNDLYKERGVSCSSCRLGEIRAVMPSTSCQLEFSRRVKKSLTNGGHTQLASSEDTLRH